MYTCDSSLSLGFEHQDIQSGFWTLWQEYQDNLYRCCVKWMGNSIDGEDALSRVMFKACEKFSNCTVEIKNFKSWITKLTYNLCVDIHRERHRDAKQVESWEAISFEYEQEIVSQEENPVVATTQEELENFFCVAIDDLPPRLHETFILYFREEVSYKEIAEKLNISYDNVRKRISQARAILQQRYYQDFLGGEDRQSTHLYESKSHTSSQSPKSRKYENINQIEACTGETVIVSEELEKVKIAEQEEAEQVVTVSPSVVVDVQSKRSSIIHKLALGNFRLINQDRKNPVMAFKIMNFPRLALVSSFAALSAVAFTSKAQAQNANVDFTGTISPAVTIDSSGSGGNQSNVDSVSSNLIRLSETLRLTANSSLIFTITSITDNGTTLSSSQTYSNIDFVGAEIKDGSNLVVKADTSPSGNSPIVYPLGTPSDVQPPPGSKTYNVVLTVANTNRLLPVGTYKVLVRVNLTPQ